MLGGATIFSIFLETQPRQNLFANRDRRSLCHKIEQLHHVVVAHANAAVAIGRADLVLMFRPVDIDETFPRIGVGFIEAIEV